MFQAEGLLAAFAIRAVLKSYLLSSVLESDKTRNLLGIKEIGKLLLLFPHMPLIFLNT